MKTVTLAEVMAVLEAWAPPALAEDYDNPGLHLGSPADACTGVLCCLDVTAAVLHQAQQLGLNLVLSHHPAWFGARRHLTPADAAGALLHQAARAGLALYGLHTDLDHTQGGVSVDLAQRLGLQQVRVLRPLRGRVMALTTYVPPDYAELVRQALHAAGAGALGGYLQGAQWQPATDAFTPQPGAQPATGGVGQPQQVPSVALTVAFPDWLSGPVLRALHQAHPYEQPAYYLMRTENTLTHYGSGAVGLLPQPLAPDAFLRHVQQVLGCRALHYTPGPDGPIHQVAVCGGSGSFLLPDALATGAQAFVTGDVTHHKYPDAQGRLLYADVGHWHSEQFVPQLMARHLQQALPGLPVHLAQEPPPVLTWA